MFFMPSFSSMQLINLALFLIQEFPLITIKRIYSTNCGFLIKGIDSLLQNLFFFYNTQHILSSFLFSSLPLSFPLSYLIYLLLSLSIIFFYFFLLSPSVSFSSLFIFLSLLFYLFLFFFCFLLLSPSFFFLSFYLYFSISFLLFLLTILSLFLYPIESLSLSSHFYHQIGIFYFLCFYLFIYQALLY